MLGAHWLSSTAPASGSEKWSRWPLRPPRPAWLAWSAWPAWPLHRAGLRHRRRTVSAAQHVRCGPGRIRTVLRWGQRASARSPGAQDDKTTGLQLSDLSLGAVVLHTANGGGRALAVHWHALFRRYCTQHVRHLDGPGVSPSPFTTRGSQGTCTTLASPWEKKSGWNIPCPSPSREWSALFRSTRSFLQPLVALAKRVRASGNWPMAAL